MDKEYPGAAGDMAELEATLRELGEPEERGMEPEEYTRVASGVAVYTNTKVHFLRVGIFFESFDQPENGISRDSLNLLKHLFGYLVGSGGKNEVIKMQAVYFMGPPRHRGFAPLGHQYWVMASLLCDITNTLAKR